MSIRVAAWMKYLGIDASTTDALREVIRHVEPEFESVMNELYARVMSHYAGADLFGSPDVAARARAALKRHWLDHVLTGRFDQHYWNSTKAIAQTHHRVGGDLMLYLGAYSVLSDQLTAILVRRCSDDPIRLQSLLQALNRALSLDKGVGVSVYYDSVVESLEEMSRKLNMSLARAGEYRDNETGRHIIRMSRMCVALSRAIGKDVNWCQMMLLASPLHDVGKIGIPDAILLKPGRLSKEEFRRMQVHPMIGGEIIPDAQAEVISMARRISLTHHERWDGSGYPVGLSGTEIPLEGRIAAICDVYDALISERPYKRPWPKNEARRYIAENSGRHFDPVLVAAFLGIEADIDDIQERFAEQQSPLVPAISSGSPPAPD